MKRHLGGCHHIQSSEIIQIRISPERLHHGLLVGFRMISLVHHIFTVFQNRIYVPQAFFLLGAQISLIVSPYRHPGFPVIFRMDQDLIVFRFMKIQDCRKDFIFYLDQL